MKKLLFYLLFAVPILGFGQTKISDMPAATTPTGTELVPIVQGGANKKATINQINSGYIKTADFYTIGDGRWLKLPSAPGSGQNGQSVRWNNGSLVWEYFSPGSTYTFSNGLTESGGAVKLGGSLTGNTTIDGDGNDFVMTNAGGIGFDGTLFGSSVSDGTTYVNLEQSANNFSSKYFLSSVTNGETYEANIENGSQGIVSKWSGDIGATGAYTIGKYGWGLDTETGVYGFHIYSNGTTYGSSPANADLKFRIRSSGEVTLNLGSDATGDIYYRNSSGYFTRLAVGSNTHVLTLAGGLPTWAAPSGGSGLTVGTSTITSGTNTRILYNNSGVLGEYTVSGSGNVAMTTSPTFTTPALGTPSALVGTNITGTATGLTSGITNALKSATTTVDVSSATAPTTGQVLTATSGTAATWQTPASASGAWLLASGGTATGTNTFAMGSNPFILTSGVTTGTGATAGFQRVYNSLTSGNGDDLSSSSYTNGAIQKITSTSTAINNTISTNGVSQIAVSGAMASSRIAIGQNISVTTTGTTSKNVGLVLNTSGATDNIALLVPTGNIGVGGNFTPSSIFHIQTSGTSVTNRVESTNSNSSVTFSAKAGGGVELLFGQYGTTKSAYGAIGSGYGYLYTGGNLAFAVDNASGAIKFGIGSSVPEVAKITTTGMILGSSSVTGDRTIKATNSATTADLILDSDNYIKMNKYVFVASNLIIGTGTVTSANDRVKINGVDDTTGKIIVANNNSGSEKFSVQGDGVININGSAGTAGQVLVSNGSSAAAWGTPTVNITGSNQRYQVQVVNIGSGVVASGTGFAGLSNTSEYANKTVLSVDFVIVMIKNDGTAVVYGKLTSIFRKDNSGTWTADVPGTATISDLTQLSGFVGDINGGAPGITWTTPGTTSGTWQLGYTAAISSTTN